MSYTKDNNAYTRGVGAIAATDGSRLRRKRKQMAARMLVDRDRALSTWTMGPGGGHPGLGAISQVGMNLRNPVLYGRPGSIDTPGTGILINQPLPPRRGSSGSPLLIPATALPPTPLLISASASAGGKLLPGGGRGPSSNAQPGSNVVVPPGTTIVTDPISGQTTLTPPGGDSGGAVTGGGGGGVVSGGSTPVDLTPPIDVPDVPDATGMSTTTKVLLAAGVLGALYLLTRKKGGGQ